MPVKTKGNKAYFYNKDTDTFHEADLSAIPKKEIDVKDCPTEIAVELVKQAYKPAED
jgi:hypothetical protein